MDPSTTLSLSVTLAVLAAAVTHAVWNAIAHGIKDQTLAFALIGVGGAAVSVPLVIVAAIPRSVELAVPAGLGGDPRVLQPAAHAVLPAG